jgi:hypothetical protein
MSRTISRLSDTDDPTLPRGCKFRFWTRAELEIGESRISFEGRAAILLRELLNNHGKRVPLPLLWAAMISDGGDIPQTSIAEAVSKEIANLFYKLSSLGILLSVDDSEPESGIMLSAVTQVSEPVRRPAPVGRKHRRVQTRPVTNEPDARPVNRDATAVHPFSGCARLSGASR